MGREENNHFSDWWWVTNINVQKCVDLEIVIIDSAFLLGALAGRTSW